MNFNVILDQQFTNNQFSSDESKQRLVQILDDEGKNPITEDLTDKMGSHDSDYQNEIWFWSYSMKHPAPFDNSDFYFSNYRMVMSFRNQEQLHFITSVFLFDIQAITFEDHALVVKTNRDQFKLNYNDEDEAKYLKESANILKGACNQAKHANGDFTADLPVTQESSGSQVSKQQSNVDSRIPGNASQSQANSANLNEINPQTPPSEHRETSVDKPSVAKENNDGHQASIKVNDDEKYPSKFTNAMPVASGGDIPDGFEFVENYYTASSDPILASTPQSYKKAMKLILEDIENEIKRTDADAGFNFTTDYDVDLVGHILNIFAYVDICKRA
ncbi:hypothetical protein WR164_03780 [Philodulcilactobacillus myokoensis]|uniref:Uncharacterized protein n=1 Tax=Philodulcilactobacillus myokoensis TaxID=2929573 RepID=A0A9W6AZR5_9LACO|nr:hypothetical protein [Philodulcilactobacillus myokoensis]GLB46399.1 hypothetical protein WR164_03780 [Philodulcilactobacillus myokoensis]